MHPTIKFYSNKDGEIFRFLSKYYDINEKISQNFDIYYHSLEWQNSYENPIEIAKNSGAEFDEEKSILKIMRMDIVLPFTA